MMRLQITHMSAPWPEGAIVGDVLDLPAIPAWAAGKCEHVSDTMPLTLPRAEVVTDNDPIESAPTQQRRGRPPKAKT